MAEAGRPSRGWYVPAVLLVVASAITVLVAMFTSINAMQFTAVELPGTLEFNVDERGQWVVCITSHDGTYPEPVPMEIRFTNDGGEELSLEPLEQNFRYHIDSVQAASVGGVDLPVGAWTMSGTRPEATPDDGQRWPYSIGPQPVDRMVRIMIVGGSIAVVLLSLGLGMCVLVFWFRWKNRPLV